MHSKAYYYPLTATPFKRNTSYIELTPCKALRPYIRCYWGTDQTFTQGENGSAPEIVIPDTCVDIIYYIDDTDHTVSGGFCGINDHSFRLPEGKDIEHTVSTFAVRFYAWSAYAFAEDSLESTLNGFCEVGSRFAWLDRILRSELPELHTLRERASFTEQILLKRLSSVREKRIIDDTIQNILINKGSLEISVLARDSLVSTRQLERLFHEYIGITPKKLCNLIRYQFLWRDIVCKSEFDVLDAVHKYGYTDQSHLLREFKRYHSMDIHKARAIAFQDVENIQENVRKI